MTRRALGIQDRRAVAATVSAGSRGMALDPLKALLRSSEKAERRDPTIRTAQQRPAVIRSGR